MAGGYLNVPFDGVERLLVELSEIERRLSEIERPSGLVEFGSISLSTTGWAVPTATYGQVASGTLAIPDGFSRAELFGMVIVGARNGAGTTGALGARCVVNGTSSGDGSESTEPGGFRTVSASVVADLSGLQGGTSMTVSAECFSTGSWGADAMNAATVDVTALFRR